MEIILELLSEKRMLRIEWGQMVRAIILALLFTGLCRYAAAYSGEWKENLKVHVLPAEEYVRFADSERMGPLMENFLENYDGRMCPEIIAEDSNHVLQEEGYKEVADTKNTDIPDIAGEKTESDRHGDMAVDSEKENTKNIAVSDPKETVSDAMSTTRQNVHDGSDSSAEDDVGEKEEHSENPATVLTIELYGNGGTPEKVTDSCNAAEFNIANYENPSRMGKLFDGWFCDKDCKEPFTKAEPGQTSLALYAGWKEFPGFLCNDKGYIVGYTDASAFLKDNLIVFPRYDTCIGIEKDALRGLEEDVYEIYIPANISFIEPGAFDALTNLIYIEAASKNSRFYSKNGILYYKNGDTAVYPKRMQKEPEEH